MNKRGISAIVATVLIILITVSSVAIIWVAIIPMIQKKLVLDEYDIQLGVDTYSGYTLYDSDNELATIQVRRGSDDLNLGAMKLILNFEGNSKTQIIDEDKFDTENFKLPGPNEAATYYFNLSKHVFNSSAPITVKIVPVFYLSSGLPMEGFSSSFADLPTGDILIDVSEEKFFLFSDGCLPGNSETCGSNVGECKPGTKICNEEEEWDVCDFSEGGKPSVFETCDNLDNDCDGSIDENDGGESLTQECGTDEGECQIGTQTCNSGNWGLCIGGKLPIVETCDNLDNDCDGIKDNNLTVQDANKILGVCSGSIKVCNGIEGWVEPDYTLIFNYEASETSCDGLDNDCDGDLDIDCACITGTNESCYGGAPGTEEAELCSAGYRICTNNGQWGECIGQALPQTEICDNLDNDCDGIKDNNLTVQDANKTFGVCGGSVKVCNGTGGLIEPDYTSISNYETSEASCDGFDNDCDGELDIDCECINVDQELCYEGSAGTKGIGLCSAGYRICTNNGQWGECIGQALPQTEICDGLDNDCDGSSDEGVKNACGECGAVPAEICNDGLDNDCDGIIDDGCTITKILFSSDETISTNNCDSVCTFSESNLGPYEDVVLSYDFNINKKIDSKEGLKVKINEVEKVFHEGTSNNNPSYPDDSLWHEIILNIESFTNKFSVRFEMLSNQHSEIIQIRNVKIEGKIPEVD